MLFRSLHRWKEPLSHLATAPFGRQPGPLAALFLDRAPSDGQLGWRKFFSATSFSCESMRNTLMGSHDFQSIAASREIALSDGGVVRGLAWTG
jgi:hypothetical protein